MTSFNWLTVALLAGIFLAIIIWYSVAQQFQRIAAMKGHNEIKYLWWSFFLGPAGWLMVVALPDRAQAVYYYNDENTGEQNE